MTPNQVNILIACEESQAECIAFRERGFNAFSCDIQKARKFPGWHIKGDVTPYLDGMTHFTTEDGVIHHVDKWHMIIAHPPCTYICKLSSVQLIKHGVMDTERYAKMRAGVQFFFKCYNAKAPFVAVENPIPMARAGLPRSTCYACPSWYGVKYTKKTLYWLHNLPPLMPSVIFPNPKSYVHCSRGKYRSRTFPAMAKAIAQQWGDFLLQEL